MGFGVVIKVDGALVHNWQNSVLPHPLNSNNVAEYGALQHCLQYLLDQGLQDHPIEIKGDSMLVIRQMQGKWKLKKGRYLPHAHACKKLLPKFKMLTFTWVPRRLNQEADQLSK